MTIASPVKTESIGASLKIRGRTMLHEEFYSRLQILCNTLGFENVKIPTSGDCGILDSISDSVQNCSEQDVVIVLSCKVHYNPKWGGFNGHPHLINRTKEGKDELCPAGFLAPFLQQYKFAQEQVYLTETRQGLYLITLPQNFLKTDEERQGIKLHIALDKVAEPDENGAITPVSTSGSRCSYTLSAKLRQALDAQNFAWTPGRSIPIGRHLSADMFFFSCVEQEIDQNSPFYSTLFPYLRQLVTHRTPHLRAAEIHLGQEFRRMIALLTAERHATFPKLLCLAGLDIDMASSMGHGEKYFVPWKAYLETVDGNGSERCSMDQDDLFVRLIQ